jgi:hypothetical protein
LLDRTLFDQAALVAISPNEIFTQVFEDIKNCRQAALQFLGKGRRSMKDYLKDIAPHFETLVEIERSWAVDVKFAKEVAVPMAVHTTQNMILDALPTDSVTKKIDDAIVALETVQKSDVCFLAELQKSVNGVIQLVRGLKVEEGPSVEEVAKYSALYKLVIKRMENFFTHTVMIQNGEDASKFIFPKIAKVLIGRPAITTKYEETLAKVDLGETFDLPSLQWVKTYSWAFTDPERIVTDKWLLSAKGLKKQGIAAICGDSAAGAVSSSSGSSGSADGSGVVRAASLAARPVKKKRRRLRLRKRRPSRTRLMQT